MNPLKSACFGDAMRQSQVPTVASLKERIKINRKLTTSLERRNIKIKSFNKNVQRIGPATTKEQLADSNLIPM